MIDVGSPGHQEPSTRTALPRRVRPVWGSLVTPSTCRNWRRLPGSRPRVDPVPPPVAMENRSTAVILEPPAGKPGLARDLGRKSCLALPDEWWYIKDVMHGYSLPPPAGRTSVISVSELNARLSSWLRKVRSGDALIVTDRGRSVARPAPVTTADDPEHQFVALAAAGLARLPTGQFGDAFFRSCRGRDTKTRCGSRRCLPPEPRTSDDG